MPWILFAYGSLQGKRLSKIFNATEIPTVAIVETNTGKLLSNRGAELVRRYGGKLFEKIEFMIDPDDDPSRNVKIQPLLSN